MKRTAKLFGIAAFVAAFATAGAGGAYAQANAFALPLSFGISTSLISEFGGGVSGRVTEAGFSAADHLGNEVYWHGSYSGFSSSIFLDAHFVQLSFGYFTSTGWSRSRAGQSSVTNFNHGNTPSPTGIEIGLLGKFPVELSPRITVFPLAGIAYRIVVTGGTSLPVSTPHNLISFDPLDSSALWFRLGGGMDFSINQNVFLRTAVSYGVRLRARWENDAINNGPHLAFGGMPQIDEAGQLVLDERHWVTYDNAHLGHGVDITIGIGFRLN